MFVYLVKNACRGLSKSFSAGEELCALSAEEATGVGAGGAACDAAHYAASSRPPCHETLL